MSDDRTMAIRPGEETAMLLTEEEWQDLAVMVGIYKVTRQPRLRSDDLDDGNRAAVEQRCALADRIREAVYGPATNDSTPKGEQP